MPNRHTTANRNQPRPSNDLTNRQFGRWKVIRLAGKNRHNAFLWECVCACGSQKIVTSNSLNAGKSKSCGCARAKLPSRHMRAYNTYWAMLQRCYNPTHKSFALYGGRGITVCPQWRESFENFYIDAGDPPAGMTLERVDNNKGYSPDNCRWDSIKAQARNRRTTLRVTIYGKSKSLAEWCEIYSTNYIMVWQRISHGWEPLRALTTQKCR